METGPLRWLEGVGLQLVACLAPQAASARALHSPPRGGFWIAGLLWLVAFAAFDVARAGALLWSLPSWSTALGLAGRVGQAVLPVVIGASVVEALLGRRVAGREGLLSGPFVAIVLLRAVWVWSPLAARPPQPLILAVVATLWAAVVGLRIARAAAPAELADAARDADAGPDAPPSARTSLRRVTWAALVLAVVGATMSAGIVAVEVGALRRTHAQWMPLSSGARLELSALRAVDGQPLPHVEADATVVVFWTSWCPMCKQFLPSLEESLAALPAAQRARMRVLAVSSEGPDADAAIAAAVTRMGLSSQLTIARGPLALERAAGVTAYPHTLLLDRDGRVQGAHAGALGAGSVVSRALALAGAR